MADGFDLLEAQGRIFGSALSAPQKLVGMALLDHWSRKHSEVFPSVSRLAKMTSQCERTVKSAIAGLEKAGVVQVKRTQGLSNRYTFAGVMSLNEETRAKRSPGNRGNSCTSAGDSPVQEMPPTSATDAPAPVQEMPPKEPSEGTKEGTNICSAKKSRSRRWSRVPKGWKPTDAHRTMATELGVAFEAELANFKDHDFAKPKQDPDACFRTWLRNAKKFQGNGFAGRARPEPQRGMADHVKAGSADDL